MPKQTLLTELAIVLLAASIRGGCGQPTDLDGACAASSGSAGCRAAPGTLSGAREQPDITDAASSRQDGVGRPTDVTDSVSWLQTPRRHTGLDLAQAEWLAARGAGTAELDAARRLASWLQTQSRHTELDLAQAEWLTSRGAGTAELDAARRLASWLQTQRRLEAPGSSGFAESPDADAGCPAGSVPITTTAGCQAGCAAHGINEHAHGTIDNKYLPEGCIVTTSATSTFKGCIFNTGAGHKKSGANSTMPSISVLCRVTTTTTTTTAATFALDAPGSNGFAESPDADAGCPAGFVPITTTAGCKTGCAAHDISEHVGGFDYGIYWPEGCFVVRGATHKGCIFNTGAGNKKSGANSTMRGISVLCRASTTK